eukprot:snap_masked-scaffold_21-processed-gene-1.26-mRNA-1 protein AED:1.00 eAED:1.00 QI:0/0/0/0/1/1/2/0/338
MFCRTSLSGNICGVHGICEADVQCLCEPGWRKTLDFTFGENIKNIDQEVCILLGALFLIVIHLIQVSRVSQLKRLLPLMACYFFYAGLAILKIINPKTFIGKDFFVTFLLGVAFFCANGSSLVFFSKYIHFQSKLVQLKPRIRGKMKLFTKLQVSVAGIDFIVSTLFIASSFLNGNSSLGVFKTALVLGTLRAIYALAAIVYLITQLLGDIIEPKLFSEKEEMRKKILQRARILRRVRAHVIWFNLFTIVLFICGISSNKILKTFSYFFPVLILLSFLMSFLVLLNYQQSRLLKFTPKYKSRKQKDISSFINSSKEKSFILTTKNNKYNPTEKVSFKL